MAVPMVTMLTVCGQATPIHLAQRPEAAWILLEAHLGALCHGALLSPSLHGSQSGLAWPLWMWESGHHSGARPCPGWISGVQRKISAREVMVPSSIHCGQH